MLHWWVLSGCLIFGNIEENERIFTSPHLLAVGFAAPPRLPLCSDANGDGLGDLLCVYPPDNGIIDFAPNVNNEKCGYGRQARVGIGPDCKAAISGDFLPDAGTEVVGLFADGSLKIFYNFVEEKYKETTDIYKFEQKPGRFVLGVSKVKGKRLGIVALDGKSGAGILLRWEDGKWTSKRIEFPSEVEWIQQNDVTNDPGAEWIIRKPYGAVMLYSENDLQHRKLIKLAKKGDAIEVCNKKLIIGKEWINGSTSLPIKELDSIAEPYVYRTCDMNGDGIEDLVVFRYGNEPHIAYDIYVLCSIRKNDNDFDKDGLSNSEEKKIGTNLYHKDTDGDGLLDSWEVRGVRGLDLPAMGCSPLKYDVICYVHRISDVDEKHVKNEMERVKNSYAQLEVTNPDGSKGISFHPIFPDPIPEDKAKGKGWPELGELYFPKNHRGIAHWMVINKGGGGQANQMGDMGGCGADALWAVFLHEFGHQLGLDHNGFWRPGLCPLYPSLMNYAYSYGFNDDGNLIHYSNGKFASYTLKETSLDEEIPLPYQEVSFLEKGPYRFRLKQNGTKTLVDWNWNGVFGEKNVRADINYGYSTTAGERLTVDKTHASPYLFSYASKAWLLYAKLPQEPKRGEDPNVSIQKPGTLYLREIDQKYTWKDAIEIAKNVTGDPAGAGFNQEFWIFYPSAEGIVYSRGEISANSWKQKETTLLPDSQNKRVTCAVLFGRLFVFLHDSKTGEVRYSSTFGNGFRKFYTLTAKSTNPVSACEDSIHRRILLTTCQDQDKDRPSRWQIRWFELEGEQLVEKGMEWVEGEGGGARGDGRLQVLFDSSSDAGPDGRVYVFGPGLRRDPKAPWTGLYVAHQIADKSVRGGWLVKRYYDEWTNSRSDSAVTWFEGDVLWSYRWVDGAQGDSDNNLQVAFHGLGIEEMPMGDFNDVEFIVKYGLKRSILYLFTN
ncbi:MAG TPA: hypothetical protein VNK96_07380 [Fimbriimonadales bacterium]|nr:hypothetical protein [Fimbriimonadales bacterium]